MSGSGSKVRLALFDCDGTLADSQHDIVSAMHSACAQAGLAPFPAARIRSTIGLSVERAVLDLLPAAPATVRDTLCSAYRNAYFAARTAGGAAPEPLYDGVKTLLDALREAGWVLGIATGKSRRGLDRLLHAHGLDSHFATLQTPDTNPSKPNPAMVRMAQQETGALAAHTCVIGDTAFDMQMARSAAVHAIGVSWGYHDEDTLRHHGAHHIAHDTDQLLAQLEAMG